MRVTGLFEGCSESVEYTRVLPFASLAAKFMVKSLGLVLSQPCHGVDAEQLKISANGWADRYQVF
jgi:hypothetical protein